MTSLEEIINSTELKAHALRFINSLSGVLETLDNANELGDMLKQVGEGHKTRNVTPEHFAVSTNLFCIYTSFLLSIIIIDN